MAEYEKKVREILKSYGCYFIRHGKGDHDIWHSPINKQNVAVDGKIKSRHTANAILKQSGINYRF
nr:type II toxin-antitoxin system HicA family toxin [uncultured Catonella sp.]